MAAPIKYKGKLTLLGSWKQWPRIGYVYSLIEIGNDTIKDVMVGEILNNYMDRALHHDGDVELEMRHSPPSLLKFCFKYGLIIYGVSIISSVLGFFGGRVEAVAIVGALSLVFVLFIALLQNSKIVHSTYTLFAVTIDGKRYTNI